MPVKSFKPKQSSGRKFNGNKNIDSLYRGNDDWKHYRLRFLAINSKCYSCGMTASVVDHLRPHQGDEKLFVQLDNHIPLCETCHNKVTGLFDRRFKAGNSIDSKISWLQLNRSIRNLTFKVKVLPYYKMP